VLFGWEKVGADRAVLTLPARDAKWAIVDSNHGPPPYQSGALTN
jgi:hypothetical protein